MEFFKLYMRNHGKKGGPPEKNFNFILNKKWGGRGATLNFYISNAF